LLCWSEIRIIVDHYLIKGEPKMRKKALYLCSIFLLVALMAAPGTLAVEKEFSFLGINWTDSPEAVKEKLEASGKIGWVTIKEANDLEQLDYLERIFLSSDLVDKERLDKMRTLGGMKVASNSTINRLQRVSFGGRRPIDEGTFFFTTDNQKLVAYNITLKGGGSWDPDENPNKSDYYRGLVEKYGKPSKKLKYSSVWTKPDQSLYHFFAGVEGMVYVNEKNLKELSDKIRSESAKFSREDSDNKRKTIKNVF